MRLAILASLGVAMAMLSACKQESASDAGVVGLPDATVHEKVCARPPLHVGPLAFGDANADDHVDIADGVFIARSALSGGHAPACTACVDISGKGVGNDVGNAAAIWYYLFAGTSTALPSVPAN